MKEGRDLRNKITIYKNKLYSIGGNNFTAERFCFSENTWKHN